MYRKLVLVSLLLLLQGCVAIFLIGAVAGGAIVYDRRNVEDKVQDQNITYEINNVINSSKVLYDLCPKNSCHIEVAAFNHVVLLIGEVPSVAARDEADKIARNVKHVKKVSNEINIGRPLSTSVQLEDSWLTTKVKSALLATKSLNSGDLKVVTSNGVVYLMGIVTPAQAELATSTTRQVDGVKKVVTLLQNSP
jgi:osmotically-inducible protein OsmY